MLTAEQSIWVPLMIAAEDRGDDPDAVIELMVRAAADCAADVFGTVAAGSGRVIPASELQAIVENFEARLLAALEAIAPGAMSNESRSRLRELTR